MPDYEYVLKALLAAFDKVGEMPVAPSSDHRKIERIERIDAGTLAVVMLNGGEYAIRIHATEPISE